MSEYKKTICIDFDGVVHSYRASWTGPGEIHDPPVCGAIAWLRSLIADPDMAPCIYSSRSKHPEGIEAMRAWLRRYGLSVAELEQLEFPTQKPAAWLTIDDRAWLFEGVFPSLEAIREFTPWNKRDGLVHPDDRALGELQRRVNALCSSGRLYRNQEIQGFPRVRICSVSSNRKLVRAVLERRSAVAQFSIHELLELDRDRTTWWQPFNEDYERVKCELVPAPVRVGC